MLWKSEDSFGCCLKASWFRDLGHDSSINKPVREIFGLRLVVVRKRFIRSKKLSEVVGEKIGSLVVSGVSPSLMHSASVWSILDNILKKARSAAFQMLGLRQASSSHPAF